MNKLFHVYWSEDGHITNKDHWKHLVETDDPVRAEQVYFKLCKKMIGHAGYVFLQSADPESVPYGRFNTSAGIVWNVEREEQDIRRHIVWSMPQEIPYKRWKSPSAYMVKGLKAAILYRTGEERGCEISGEAIGHVLGRSARGVRYWIAEDGETRSIDYANWRCLLEMAGFKNKPITTYL
ncbi:TPA: hypothetical protein ACMDRZ_002993 [Vibrio cholerae]|uniref:Uncharacterized protein n=1 Tax=Vibrio vulnificus TaxID=672 RepID=A0AAI8ZKT1_VIBVL|nr:MULTISPECIES: hypothetical protein [Vibrio]EHU8077635.1 hypothetical protein [Vibrio cholerae]EHV9953691.1 hypothetical protein [Vibrio cholerae]EKF9218916.1 hypothetical protein [Vibrio cholerae]MEB5557023.1 hypothetical protein [Vibrio cholerae]OQK43733.1 hypothetical protein XM75_u0014 [Vibrio vulnificus]